jgi:hypothetical protein
MRDGRDIRARHARAYEGAPSHAAIADLDEALALIRPAMRRLCRISALGPPEASAIPRLVAQRSAAWMHGWA